MKKHISLQLSEDSLRADVRTKVRSFLVRLAPALRRRTIASGGTEADVVRATASLSEVMTRTVLNSNPSLSVAILGSVWQRILRYRGHLMMVPTPVGGVSWLTRTCDEVSAIYRVKVWPLLNLVGGMWMELAGPPVSPFDRRQEKCYRKRRTPRSVSSLGSAGRWALALVHQ